MTREDIAEIQNKADLLKVEVWKRLKLIPTTEYKNSHSAMQDMVKLGKLAQAWLDMQSASSNMVDVIR